MSKIVTTYLIYGDPKGSQYMFFSNKICQLYAQKGRKGKAEVFSNAIKHDFRSKNPTTRWSDIIKLK